MIIVIAAIIVAGYRMSTRDTGGTSSGTSTQSVATSTSPTASSTTPGTPVVTTTSPQDLIPLPGATTGADLSAWKQYTNSAKGYSLLHPMDLIRSTEADGSVTLTFPKNVYFHWPLLDDAKITISVGPKCPAITAAGLGGDSKPISFELNGRNWKRTLGFEVAAGNRYEEIAYDMFQNAICYHIGFRNHGANGSSLYVDDNSLIKKYDAAHQVDLDTVIRILNAIVSTFTVSGLKG